MIAFWIIIALVGVTIVALASPNRKSAYRDARKGAHQWVQLGLGLLGIAIVVIIIIAVKGL